MKTILAIALIVLGCPFLVQSQMSIPDLPKGAVIVESRPLPLRTSNRKRTLVLWSINPKKNPNNYKRDDIYTCPDYSRGSYYSGPTRVSLIDSTTNRIINTINVSKDYEEGTDSFDLPYAIRKGYYYRVDTQTVRGAEAKPTIMWLRDYNGDGTALEFALFDAVACMGLETSLIGYSSSQDRVVQYPIQIESIEQSKKSTMKTTWADYLMSTKPKRPGYWKYEVDYRGRGGSLDQWEVRYNASKEQFEATVRRSGDQ